MSNGKSERVLAFVLLFVGFGLGGCGVSRTVGPGPPIGSCDYCVLGMPMSQEDAQRSESILAKSFVVLPSGDPRLDVSVIRDRTCVVSLDWRRGFWSSSEWVQVKDYQYGANVLTSRVRHGMFWSGVQGGLTKALHDVADARGSRPIAAMGSADPAPAPSN